MTGAPAPHGHYREPRQARSAETLEKTLRAAEELALEVGVDKVTIAAVAERAGVSVGAIYRRFEGKDQLVSALTARLLDRRQSAVAVRLSTADPSLPGVMNAYAHALMESFADSHRLFPDLLSLREADSDDHGADIIAGIRELLRDAAGPYVGAIRRSDPITALDVAGSAILGACFHGIRRLNVLMPNVSTDEYADALGEMATTYLLTPDHA